ncbi:hypothetical protein [Actinoplanes sp. NPDC026619]|uniref:hypothetical protein n=1 Tax=Actinoplanes sp. NPDC026619 TaxID=3155798 RepID=UPI0033D6E7E2
MMPTGGENLLSASARLLAQLLPDDAMEVVPVSRPDSGADAVWEIRARKDRGQLFVLMFNRFIPSDVDAIRDVLPQSILVVAPWISPRSRDLLVERGFNYLDLTGNVRVRIARPAVYLRVDGAANDPQPPVKRPVQLRGAGINALVRTLVDFAPPYKLVELAATSGLSNGYVSRALAALADERLIRRAPRSRAVTEVDWSRLLIARAENYSLLKSNSCRTYLARTGPNALLRQLTGDDRAVVTGSFAAQPYVQVAAPTQLTLYVPDADAFAAQHTLMPTDQGANVILLSASDSSQLVRARKAGDGTFYVGLSQLVLDCLAGNGRLPEEGSALLEWMADNPSAWRTDQIPGRT